MTVNVYERYFEAEGCFSGVERRAALVMLTSDSCEGTVAYTAAVTFFPHSAPDDFAVSYDAYFGKELYRAKGRRSKKREAALLGTLQAELDLLARENGAEIFWERPLREERRG